MGVCNFKVLNLVDWQNLMWRRPSVQQLFPDEILNKIFSIHIPRCNVTDECYWTPTQYAIMSAYFLVGKEAFDSLWMMARGIMWKKIWGMNLLSKMALFCLESCPRNFAR